MSGKGDVVSKSWRRWLSQPGLGREQTLGKAQRREIAVLAWEHRMASDIWKGRLSQVEKERNEVGPRSGKAPCAEKSSLGYLLRRIRSRQKGWAFLDNGAVDTSQVGTWQPHRMPSVSSSCL